MRVKTKLNYTGRKRIQNSMVNINLIFKEPAPPAFDAHLDLKTLSLPSDATIYIEAYRNTSRQRFLCGSVKAFALPEDRTLTEVDLDGPILFRIKVVDHSGKNGRLLASAERLKALNETDDSGQDYLLKVSKRNLGKTPWKLTFSEDYRPELMFNLFIPDAINLIKTDHLFKGLVLPPVIREVYTHIFLVCGGSFDPDSWQQKWLDFGHQTTGSEPHDPSDSTAVADWIDDMVETFSDKHALLDNLSARLTEEH